MKHLKVFESFELNEVSQSIKLWNAYMGLVDGIDGIISEEGELSSSYWKDNVQADLDKITGEVKTEADVKKNTEAIMKNLTELLDGLDGYIGSGRIEEDRYFKKGAIKNAKFILNWMNHNIAAEANWKKNKIK